jgi:RimJ/RimL family protein N-acetyltransferase
MIAAAVRAGFVLEGTTRDAAWIDGGFADGVTLSLLSGEWPPASQPTGRSGLPDSSTR